MDGIIAIGGTLALFLLVGGLIGLADRKRFAPHWLLIAAALVAVNDALLTRGYHNLPNLFVGVHWNWEGKLLALAATLVIASLPMFTWKQSGLTFAQNANSLKSTLLVFVLYCGFFLLLALAFPNGKSDGEEIAFQLTMPGFEEEPFYRGILLFALDRAFIGRIRFAGVDWGWGAVLSCFLFGLAHAFGFSNGHFSFDLSAMALTALPAFIGVWLRLRTGSLLFPILMHNFGNAISLFI